MVHLELFHPRGLALSNPGCKRKERKIGYMKKESNKKKLAGRKDSLSSNQPLGMMYLERDCSRTPFTYVQT